VPSTNDRPRALVTDELLSGAATTYEVALTCSEDEPNRFVFQYAHELAHFYLTPIEHPLFEVLAVAISFFALEECSRRWAAAGQNTRERSYAPKFQQYHDTVVAEAASRVGHGLDVLQVMPRDCASAKSIVVDDRHILLGALLCERVLTSFRDWRPLLTLHRCATDEGYVDFDIWLAESGGDAFRAAVCGLLGPIFHIAPSLRTSSIPLASRLKVMFRHMLSWSCCCLLSGELRQ
jgi:hypothetical protein